MQDEWWRLVHILRLPIVAAVSCDREQGKVAYENEFGALLPAISLCNFGRDRTQPIVADRDLAHVRQ